jgi:glucose 1-dehydrogenase
MASKPGRLAGRTAIVTGASSGIGRAIALRFASEGAFVVCGDHTQEPREGGEATHEVILRDKGAAAFVQSDVRLAIDNARLVEAALEHSERLDVLVANAGIGGPAAVLHEMREEDWDAVMAVNLRGAFLSLRASLAQMATQPIAEGVRGRCIAIASNHGMVGPPRFPAYAASKGGLINLVRQAAVDYGPQDILVNAVAPGKILRADDDEDVLAYARGRTPFARLGHATDVAAAALFLAADASYVSGACISVDGGWMAY